MASKTLKQEFPLHWLAWHNNFTDLDRELNRKEVRRIERADRKQVLCGQSARSDNEISRYY